MGGAAKKIFVGLPRRTKTAHIDELFLEINSRQPVLASNLNDALSCGEK
jgi:hypothetical protein